MEGQEILIYLKKSVIEKKSLPIVARNKRINVCNLLFDNKLKSLDLTKLKHSQNCSKVIKSTRNNTKIYEKFNTNNSSLVQSNSKITIKQIVFQVNQVFHGINNSNNKTNSREKPNQLPCFDEKQNWAQLQDKHHTSSSSVLTVHCPLYSSRHAG